MPTPHIGEFLLEEWLRPLEISQYQLAKDIKVPAMRISEIVRGKRSITVDTAIRLGKYFGISAEYWLKIQAHCDIELAKEEKIKIGKEVKHYKTTKKYYRSKLIDSPKADITLHR